MAHDSKVGGNGAMNIRHRAGYKKRLLINRIFFIAMLCAVAIVLLPLVAVLWSLISRGLPHLSLDFFINAARPVGEEGGGIGHALLGSAMIVGLALGFAAPPGIAAGFLMARNRSSRLAWIVRMSADVLSGVPSIVVGIFAYAVAVMPVRHFSALSGSVALAVIMWPLIARATEEVVRMVPADLTEAGLALGARRFRVALFVVLPTALPGISSAIIGAVARATGETAPLLFTAFGSQFYSLNPFEPMASVPVVLFNYAISPYESWRGQAWAAAFVLCMLVLIGTLLSRYLVARRMR